MTYAPQTAIYRSYVRQSQSFKSGKSSPTEFLEVCLSKIEAREPDVKAFVQIDLDDATALARSATKRWRKGEQFSPIDGMPVAIKDCFDVKGFRTGNNSALFDDEPVASVDSAHVSALRKGGAIIIGKTVTTEVTMALPGTTWNPWDKRRTPGGSSSGSGAAVGAGMVPLATGSQVRGSVIRPASICGVPGFKPSFGALNSAGGFDPSPGLNHLGFLGASFDDIWATACVIALGVGGEPGHRTLQERSLHVEQKRPVRLARQYTRGWEESPESTKQLFQNHLLELADFGVEIIEPDQSEGLRLYEKLTAEAPSVLFPIALWECRAELSDRVAAAPERASQPLKNYMEQAGKMKIEDYESALENREKLRTLHRELRANVDGFITLAHIGPGQIGQMEGGTPWYNDASSLVGAPSVNIPALVEDGAPLGVQLMGFEYEDRALLNMATWYGRAFNVATV